MSGSVSVTVDVDGVAGLACRPVAGGWARRLSSLSAAHYGVRRGLPRILATLADFDARATFYVPGVIARDEPDAIRAIVAAGHEVAHHGFAHLPTVELDPAGEREELQRGLDALDGLAVRPVGYRSPAWELTPVTLKLLTELGFVYDSSLMGDDRPYRLDGGLLELPVHWSLDDVPSLAFHPERPVSPSHAHELLAAWRHAADLARAEERHLTYTLHPEHAGRTNLLRDLLDHLTATGTPLLTHAAVARDVP